MATIVQYSIVYKDRLGKYVTTIYSWHKLEYAKKENDFGSLYIDLPDIYPIGYFEIDGRFEVWRQVGALPAYIDLDTFWLIRLVRYKYSTKGERYIHILCHDALNIMDRRIVAYSCDTSYTKKKTEADKMILAIARENFGSLCVDTTRSISSYLSIDSDPTTSICPVLEKSFCRQKTLSLFQSIAEESTNSGVYLAFDVIYGGLGLPIFRTFTGSRGIDRGSKSKNPFKFGVDIGNLEYATYAFDHSEEYNYIYAGGSGQGDDRIIATATNAAWVNKSPINRREDFIDVRNESTDPTVQSQADARLAEAGPKQVLNGHIIQTLDSLYGVHYGFGDIVNVIHKDYSLNVHLDTVNIVVDSNGEDVKIYTRNMDDTEY